MKTEEDKDDEKEVSKWPFLWAGLLYTVGNVDYFVIPVILEPLGISFWPTFWIAAIVANIEVIPGFLFWRWFIWKWLPTTKPIKDTVELTKSVVAMLKEYGLLETIKYKTLQTFKWATSPKGKFIGWAKRWEHFGMFILGAESIVSGGRLAGTIICASTKWKAGLYSLMAGNMIHVAISIGTWKLMFYLWGEYKAPMIIFGAVFGTVLYIWKKFRKNK